MKIIFIRKTLIAWCLVLLIRVFWRHARTTWMLKYGSLIDNYFKSFCEFPFELRFLIHHHFELLWLFSNLLIFWILSQLYNQPLLKDYCYCGVDKYACKYKVAITIVTDSIQIEGLKEEKVIKPVLSSCVLRTRAQCPSITRWAIGYAWVRHENECNIHQ